MLPGVLASGADHWWWPVLLASGLNSAGQWCWLTITITIITSGVNSAGQWCWPTITITITIFVICSTQSISHIGVIG
jgi:hypothetical protein